MLLLTATSTPLSTTDARYVYRCLDAASKHAEKLSSAIKKASRLTKTLLSRCHNLALSTHKKLARCSTVLGDRNPLFNSILDIAGMLTSFLGSHLLFPARFGGRKPPGAPEEGDLFTARVQALREGLRELLQVVGDLLAARNNPSSVGASEAPKKEKETKPTVLEEFFTKVEESKGWKVQRVVASRKTPETTFPDLDTDPFGLGCHIAHELSKPYTTLLPDEVEVGLVSFSIILLEAYRLPETVLSTCGSASPLHRVFGSYVILQDALLIGVHRDLMKVMKNGQGHLDERRFQQFIPYLSKSLPDRAHQLAQTFPSGPPRYARHHYYSPLLPRTLIKGASQFSLGNWSFLTEKRNARTGTLVQSKQ